MLQNRRVFDQVNSILNYVFLVFALLCGLYFMSFWTELKPEFIQAMVNVVNVVAWCVTGVSVIMVALALWIAIVDRDVQVLTVLWCVVRMGLCIALTVFIDVCSILVDGLLSVSL